MTRPHGRYPSLKWVLLSLVLVLGFVSAASAAPDATQSAAPTTPKPLHIGFMRNIFIGFTPQDAKAATRVWGNQFLNRNGLTTYSADPIIFDGVADLISAVNADAVDVFSLTTFDWIRYHDRLPAIPWGYSLMKDREAMKYVLLVRADGPFKSLADLKDARLLVAPFAGDNVADAWLNVILLQKGLPESQAFFSSVKQVSKPERAIIPVFFKQSDVCLVRQDAFTLSAELNPQISKQLKILATSPVYMGGLFCIRSNFPAAERESLHHNLITIGDTVAGRQILNLFHMNTTVDWDDKAFETDRELFETYRKLTGHAPGETGASNVIPGDTGRETETAKLP